jgi:hypothetical protein
VDKILSDCVYYGEQIYAPICDYLVRANLTSVMLFSTLDEIICDIRRIIYDYLIMLGLKRYLLS